MKEWAEAASTVYVDAGDNVLFCLVDGQEMNCAGTLWMEAVDTDIAVSCEVGGDMSLDQTLKMAAEEQRVVPVNPRAALLKAIRRDGLSPTSDEFTVEFDGVQYVAQQAQDLEGGPWFVYYCEAGDWDAVKVANGV